MSAILEVHGIKISYGDFALGEIDFSLDEGLFLGLVGPNGAGKTTLIKAILGITPPDSGEIRLFGKSLATDEVWCKSRIGFVLGESRLWENLTPRELGSALSIFYRDWDRREYESLLDRFEIPQSKKAVKFSSGMKTRLSLAAALSHHARLLVLDEPTAGLDPLVRREVISALGEYLSREGTSVVFSSHITSDLDKGADYLLFLLEGKKKYFGPLGEYVDGHARVRADPASLDAGARARLFGLRESATVSEGITAEPGFWRSRAAAVCEGASLEDILVAAALEEKAARVADRGGAR